ncbi:histidine phosphotransferase family protein [Sulfitobacter sp. HNIBRBA2951]|uniref:histidine phosphotransferase family protein n=1 Tax=Sulfitobacter aquimarinus TaxID=3158557 RepID=UPI0032DFB8C5
MIQKNTDFAALIGSRICHDLISPIGAINNGIELLEMSKPAPSPEMSLISESVSSASARIRFFRIAFGAAGDQMVGRPEIMSIVEDVYSGGRLTVAWGPLDGQMRGDLRLSFLGLLCLETAMPFGGRIEVEQNGNAIVLKGHADKFILDDSLWERLDGKPGSSDLRPAHVQFGLLPMIANDEGKAIKTAYTQTMLSITL